MRDLVRALNTEYLAVPALWERDTEPAGFAWILADAAEDNVLAFLRFAADGSPLLAVSNFSPVVREGYRLEVPDLGGCWREILNTDAACYGGSGVANTGLIRGEHRPADGRPASVTLTLPPLATVWLRADAERRG